MASRELRSRLLTLAVLALLAGGLYLVARRADLVGQPRAVGGALYPGLDTSALDYLHVTLREGHDLEFRRQPGGRWRITAPTQDAARQEWIEVILDNLARAQVEPVEEPEDTLRADAVGLDPPKHVIRFGVGGPQQTLRLGEVEPLGRMLYARRGGDARIVLATRNLITILQGHGGDFVDPALIRGIAGNVTSVLVRDAGQVRLDARRTGDRWVLQLPEPVLADESRIAGLVRALTFLQQERTLDPLPTSSSFHDYGLPDEAERAAGEDHGAMCVTLGAAGEQPVSIWLAAGWREQGDDTVAAVRDGPSKIVGVPRPGLAPLLNDAEFFRQSSVLPPIAERARALRIERGGEALLDIRRGQDDRWTFHAPERLAGQPVEAERIAGHSVLSEFLERLEAIEAIGFTAPPEGEPVARLSVTWTRAGQDVLDRVDLHAPVPEGVPARTSERPAEGLLLPTSVLALVDPLQAELLRSTRALAIDAEAWGQLVLVHPEAPEAGEWRLVRDAEGSWTGDDDWSRRYAIGVDLARGFRGLKWQPARPRASYPWAVRFEDVQGAPLAGLRLRLPADDEARELWGLPVALAAVDGYPDVELMVAREWIDRIDALARPPERTPEPGR